MLPGGAAHADWRWGGAASLHSILEPMASPSPSSHHNCFTHHLLRWPLFCIFFNFDNEMIYQQFSTFLYEMFSSTLIFFESISRFLAYNVGHLSANCLIRFLKRESASSYLQKDYVDCRYISITYISSRYILNTYWCQNWKTLLDSVRCAWPGR